MAKVQAFDLLYLFKLFFRYRWFIIGVIVATGLVAVIGSSPAFYPPQFYASRVIYPANTQRYEGLSILAQEPNVYIYGDAKDVEKLDNLSKTEQLRLKVVDSLDLWDAYGVDKNGASPKFDVLETYHGQVSTLRVQGNGLRISAYDTDPQRAADIVNYTVDLIEEWNQQMIIQNHEDQIRSWAQTLSDLQKLQTRYMDSVQMVRQAFNILDPERQTEQLLEELLNTQTRLQLEEARFQMVKANYGTKDTAYLNTQARIQGLRNSLNLLSGKRKGAPINLESFREGYDKVLRYEGVSVRLIEEIENIEQKISQMRSLTNLPASTLIKGSPALAADKKSRPVRWIILAASLIVATLASLLGVILIDQFVKLQAKSQAA